MRRRDRRRRAPVAPAAGPPAQDDGGAAPRRARARRADRGAMGLGGDDLRPLRLRARLASVTTIGWSIARGGLRAGLPGRGADAARRPRGGDAHAPAPLRPHHGGAPRLPLALARLVGGEAARRPARAATRRRAAAARRCSSSTGSLPAMRSTASRRNAPATTGRARCGCSEAFGDRRARDARALALPPRDRLGRRARGGDAARRPCAATARRPHELPACTVWDGIWLRLVDVEAALTARSYATDGRVTFEVVSDPSFADNVGTWTVTDGVARRSRRRPDVRLDVQALGAAYLGGFSFAQLARRRAGGGGVPRRSRARGRAVRHRRRALVPGELLRAHCVGVCGASLSVDHVASVRQAAASCQARSDP